ncbi:L,D-transpeptidase [Sinisalibacter lacisalsi]|uniref:L,D-transpeptidase n=1 Tax=Sinisalibacter lacisalsi TaxID=1526570 RepID=A0ABQ1QRF7_9RHOB|nr:L,D-transpeptidase [Sinisalibacter lacisalsi]GGD38469.1 L,D-transpeptidase [Sinisalibacter lacisalsi]
MIFIASRIVSAARLGFAATAILAALAAAAPASERLSTSNRSNQIVIRVDVSDQEMTVMQGGRRLYSWPVSTAKRGKITPAGTYQPQWFSRNHRSSLYDDAPMPFSIFYDGNYAIHGTYSTAALGRPASNGCVRLHPESARTLYEMVYAHGKDNTYIVVQE